MNCMKCGREIPSGQVFCEECLQEMAKYPVDPDTQVAIPQRTQTGSFRKSGKRRTTTAEEQVHTLKKTVHTLAVLLVLTVLLIIGLLIPAVQHLMEDKFAPGQNYSSIVSTTAPSVSETTP